MKQASVNIVSVTNDKELFQKTSESLKKYTDPSVTLIGPKMVCKTRWHLVVTAPRFENSHLPLSESIPESIVSSVQ